MSTVICTDVVEMSPDSDNWIGHETVSDKCNTSVYIQDLDYKDMFGGRSRDASVKDCSCQWRGGTMRLDTQRWQGQGGHPQSNQRVYIRMHLELALHRDE
jgi:hypothetical protein